MLIYVARRLAQAVPLIIGIVVLNFLLLRLAPGDAAMVLAGELSAATPEYMALLRTKFGLDEPMYIQLWLYLKNLLVFDLGFSHRHSMPVINLIMERLWPTVLLMGATFVLSFTLGILLGVVLAFWARTWADTIISQLATMAYATPLFWLGLMLIVLFSINLGWFPASGMETIAAFYTGWDRVTDVAWHLVLPAVTLSLFYMAFYTRLMRATTLEQFRMAYVSTAHAKGLSGRQIMFRHVFRNAILPLTTMASVQIGGLLGGSVVVESVFGWPGLGLLAYESLASRDFNLLLGIFFMSACLVIAVNVIADVLYCMLDPRVILR